MTTDRRIDLTPKPPAHNLALDEIMRLLEKEHMEAQPGGNWAIRTREAWKVLKILKEGTKSG